MRILLIFLFPIAVFASAVYESTQAGNTIAQLASKELKTVQTYSGFMFNVVLVGGRPDVNINYLYIDKNTSSNNTVYPVLIERSGVSLADEKIILNEIDSIPSLTNGSIKQANDALEGDDLDIKGTIRFNYYDSQGRKRLVEWFDQEMGFNTKTAYFDENEKLIGVTFYAFLQINKQSRNFHGFGHTEILHLDKTKFHKDVKLVTIKESEDFGNDLLEKILKAHRIKMDG